MPKAPSKPLTISITEDAAQYVKENCVKYIVEEMAKLKGLGKPTGYHDVH